MKSQFHFTLGTLLAFAGGLLLLTFGLFLLWLVADDDRYIWAINGPGFFAQIGGVQWSLFGFIAPVLGLGLIITSLMMAHSASKK
ncbi:MAG: hypothetical protein WC266_01915 [Patescibacteria group bacterium]